MRFGFIPGNSQANNNFYITKCAFLYFSEFSFSGVPQKACHIFYEQSAEFFMVVSMLIFIKRVEHSFVSGLSLVLSKIIDSIDESHLYSKWFYFSK